MRSRLALLLVLCLAGASYASSGDQSYDFEHCVRFCERQECAAGRAPTDFALRLTGWSCTDDCKYACMHDITDKAIARGQPVEQYYGKWPFWRFAGMQEPASVAFSLLNLWAHAQGARKVKRFIRETHPLRRYYWRWALVSMNAWVWSAVFHTRDLPWTERLDYFSAALAILYALYIIVLRLLHLYVPERERLTLSQHPRRTGYIAWSTLCTLVYLGHISYLSLLPRFDYTYNMAFNLALGMFHNLLYMLFALPLSLFRRYPYRKRAYRPAVAGRAALFITLTTAATALELFDFPPWARVLDAHALWHLATVPISYFWYDFLVQDAQDDGWYRSGPEYVPV